MQKYFIMFNKLKKLRLIKAEILYRLREGTL